MVGEYTQQKIGKNHFRIDGPAGERIGSAWTAANAVLIANALNIYSGRPVEWSCGHHTGCTCAECHQELVRKANIFVEVIDDLLEEVGGNAAVAARKKLTPAFHNPISPADSKPGTGH